MSLRWKRKAIPSAIAALLLLGVPENLALAETRLLQG